MMRLIESIKVFFLSFIGRCSNGGKASFVLSYFHNRKRLPNLKQPKNLSELWIKRVLDGEINEIANLADKYAVRKFVEDRGLGSILTPLIAVYSTPDEMDFSVLPERFALKANFGAGNNIICLDKSKINESDVCRQMKRWLGVKHYSESERHYNLIPKKIVCEEFIDDGSGGFPVDYKFMCIKGEVVCILACSGREKGQTDYLPYDVEWKPLFDYYKEFPKNVELLPCPLNLQAMIEVARQLSAGIDLVRVDLYSNSTRIWFGEMTLTPAGCIFHRWSDHALEQMGEYYLTH